MRFGAPKARDSCYARGSTFKQKHFLNFRDTLTQHRWNAILFCRFVSFLYVRHRSDNSPGFTFPLSQNQFWGCVPSSFGEEPHGTNRAICIVACFEEPRRIAGNLCHSVRLWRLKTHQPFCGCIGRKVVEQGDFSRGVAYASSMECYPAQR